MSHASANARIEVIKDSLRYWKMSDPLCAPTDFLIPTSLAFREALAVERFIKLMQAMTKIKAAIMENSLTYSIRPPAGLPFSKLPYKYRLAYGCKKSVTFDCSSFSFTKVLILFSKGHRVAAFLQRNECRGPVIPPFQYPFVIVLKLFEGHYEIKLYG